MYLYRKAAFLFLFLTLSCTQNEAPKSTTPESSQPGAAPLRICTGTTYSILVTIAEQKGLFAKEGLAVELKPYAIGRDALEAMLAGSCELATSADTPVADYGVRRNDLRVIAGIAKSDRLCYIVARKKAKIRQISDLKGRTVGVTMGTAPHFFLDLVLNKHTLAEQSLQLKFLKGAALHRALVENQLDAIATTDLNALRLREKLGDQVVLIGDPGIVLNHGYLTTLDASLEQRSGDIERVVRALKAAEQIVTGNPAEAKQLFSKYLQVSAKISDQIWSGISPRLSLGSAMVMTLEDNARWLQERHGTARVHKSFKEIIKPEFLQKVAPDSVNLF